MDEAETARAAIARSAMAKASWRILPLILLSYLVAYMDRSNISFASLQMNVDLGFSATVYGLGAGLFFVGYSLFEVPSNLLLQRIGALLPDLVGGVGRVQQENRSLSGVLKYVDLVQEVELVAGHKAGAVYEIGGADGPRTRAQVRDRDRTRFL